MAETTVLERTAVVLRGRRLEYFTIAWNALEGLVAEQRIRSVEKNEECTAPGVNAEEPRNPSEKLQGMV